MSPGLRVDTVDASAAPAGGTLLERTPTMLFFFNVRVDHTGVSVDELWDEWEKEVNAAEGAVSAGKIKSLYKVSGQRRVLGVIGADSHDELDRIFMAALPMAHMLEFEEILPIRDYADFGNDVRARWK